MPGQPPPAPEPGDTPLPPPVPVLVVLVDGQEVRGRLYSWQQTKAGWQGDVGACP
ncbi:hypothetical protein AB4225_35970 [Streptomyces sp. 2RAF24]|uniref:hypothetical protein n=1 Tax=unclassified Streptomyces TaxID=2593676 RepID=UPI0033E05B2F